jgi:hypothetical protein
MCCQGVIIAVVAGVVVTRKVENIFFKNVPLAKKRKEEKSSNEGKPPFWPLHPHHSIVMVGWWFRGREEEMGGTEDRRAA